MAKAGATRSDGRLVLAAKSISLDVSLQHGTLTFSDPSSGRLALTGHARVALEDGRRLSSDGRPWSVAARPARFDDRHGAGTRALMRSPGDGGLSLLLEAAVYDGQPFALLRLGLSNEGTAPVRVRQLAPLVAELGLDVASPAAARFYRHGWQSWSPSLSLGARQRDVASMPPVLAPEPPREGRGVFASDEVGVVFDEASGRSLLLGFVTARQQWTQVWLDAARRTVEVVANADGKPVARGETLWSERLLVDITAHTNDQLARCAGAVGREMGARVGGSTPTGWCSWYYYFSTVTEGDVVRNLRFLAEHREQLPLEYVQIDDGWQANIGDWLETNETFPRGMAWLADQVRAAGCRPAIWLAPFMVGANSALFREHPDWVVRDDRAPVLAMRNWNQECYAVDCTHPGAIDWLRDVFGTVTHDWGYEYVKIDFLYAAAVAGRRHDPDATRIEAYRRGLETIRAVVGQRFVLGCGALMGPSVGLVDGQRIGPDVAPWWRWNRPVDPPRPPGRPRAGGEPATENALRNVLTRAWMHGRLWSNDPDCLLAGASRTKLTLPEVRSLATAIAMSGGMVLVSDDLPQLSPDRLDLVSLLLPSLGEAATVPDLLEAEMPARMELEVRRPFESWWLVAAFNWSGRRRELQVPLPRGRWQTFELWERRYWGEHEGDLALPDTPVHGARLLALRPPLERPQLLGTSFHYSMGGREIEDASWDGRKRVLVLRMRPVAKQRGELFVHAPRGFAFEAASLDGRSVAARDLAPGVLAFAFELREPAELAVRFSKHR